MMSCVMSCVPKKDLKSIGMEEDSEYSVVPSLLSLKVSGKMKSDLVAFLSCMIEYKTSQLFPIPSILFPGTELFGK